MLVSDHGTNTRTTVCASMAGRWLADCIKHTIAPLMWRHVSQSSDYVDPHFPQHGRRVEEQRQTAGAKLM